MFLKSKKFLISMVSLSLLSVTSLSCFATAGSDGQTPGDPSQSSSSSQIGKIITLDNPNINYTLVGKDKSSGITPNDSIIIVDQNDRIQITKSGTYNIIMDNVYIDVSNVNKASAFSFDFNTTGSATVNLTLSGQNTLKGRDYGIRFNSGKDLCFSKDSTGSIEIYGKTYNGIDTNNVTVDAGNISVTGKKSGISTTLTVNGGEVKVVGETDTGIIGTLVMNGGNVNATGKNNGISDLDMRGGNLNVMGTESSDICASFLSISGGNIITSGKNGTGFESLVNIKELNFDINTITGGKINGKDAKEFLINLSNSSTPKETAFDKELSSDTKSVNAETIKSAPDTGRNAEDNLLLIYLSLGLVSALIIFSNRKELIK